MAFVDEQRRLRQETFIGRRAELERFAKVIADAQGARVVFVHGPGGIGKTSLLLEIAGQSATAFYVEAEEQDLQPDALRGALAPAFAVGAGRTLLLLDGWDRAAPLDGWLRQSLLPTLPAHVTLVIAQRDPPTAAWRSLAGWGTLIQSVELQPLDDRDSRALLERLHVSSARIDAALAFAHGHPLALHLTADALRHTPDLDLAAGSSSVVQTLVVRLLETASSASERAALEVGAVVHTLTEPLLAALLPGEDATMLFRWLAGLAVVRAHPSGLRLHDLARDTIAADLRWRNPARWNQLVEAAHDWLVRTWLNAHGRVREQLGVEVLYLAREVPWLDMAGAWEHKHRPHIDLAQPSDSDGVRRLVAQHEGDESAALAVGWLQRQPDSTYLYRDEQPSLAGITSIIRLAHDSGSALGWDPGATAAWRAITKLGALRRGETALLIRHAMSRDAHQTLAGALLDHLALVNRAQIAHPGLRYGLFVLANPDFWQSILRMPPVAGADFEVGGRSYAIFVNDYRLTRPIDSLRRTFRVWTNGEPPDPRLRASRIERLAEGPFAEAVRQAFRDLDDERALADNPLAHSRLTWVSDEELPRRVATLRRLLVESVQLLDGANRLLREVLQRTYVTPAPVQKQVAYDLGLSFSAYRRALTRALGEVSGHLWEKEIA